MSEPDNCSVKNSWGQPTARVCLCCFKGSHQGMLLNCHCICAKGLRMVSTDLTDLQRTSSREAATPFFVSPFQCVVGCFHQLCCRKWGEHPVSDDHHCCKQDPFQLENLYRGNSPDLLPLAIQSQQQAVTALWSNKSTRQWMTWPSQGEGSLTDGRFTGRNKCTDIASSEGFKEMRKGGIEWPEKEGRGVHSFKFVVGCCLVEVEKEVQNRMDDRPCQQELYRNHAGNSKLSAHARLLESPSISTLSISQANSSPVLLSMPSCTCTNM